jgi:hypothetical protein
MFVESMCFLLDLRRQVLRGISNHALSVKIGRETGKGLCQLAGSIRVKYVTVRTHRGCKDLIASKPSGVSWRSSGTQANW